MLLNKGNRKLKIALGMIALVLLVTAGAGTYYLNFYKEDFNKHLPLTFTMESDDYDLEDVAYKSWFALMQPYTGREASSWKRLLDVRYNNIQLLAGDENEFAVAVTFWAKLEKGKWSTHNNWGKVQEDGIVEDIQWTFRIRKTGENDYMLEHIEETSHAVAGLGPVEDQYQKDAGIKVPDANNRYQINNGMLEVTYDNGANWQFVPASIEDLFAGDYGGSEKDLIDGSYVITPDRTAFVIGEANNLKFLQSTDMGETWDEVDVPTSLPNIRLRFLGFTSEQDGYLILTGERTMGFEAHTVFKTSDGGKNWVESGFVQDTNRLVTSGGFINDSLGFISFGSVSVNEEPERPSLYRTIDGGKDWDEVDIPIPTEYKGIFTVAEVPTFDGTQGTLLVNQGPNGDYQGGKVLARFISVDRGTTWYFANLVDPDHVIDR